MSAQLRARDPAVAGTGAAQETRIAELQRRLDQLLNQLAGALADLSGPDAPAQSSPALPALQARVRLLGQLAAGLTEVASSALPEDAAGYGSTVLVENAATRQRQSYVLMVGSLVDIDAGQVSLGSPVGQALLGRHAGDVVRVALPQRTLLLKILEVRTLDQLLEAEYEAANGGAGAAVAASAPERPGS